MFRRHHLSDIGYSVYAIGGTFMGIRMSYGNLTWRTDKHFFAVIYVVSNNDSTGNVGRWFSGRSGAN